MSSCVIILVLLLHSRGGGLESLSLSLLDSWLGSGGHTHGNKRVTGDGCSAGCLKMLNSARAGGRVVCCRLIVFKYLV